MDIEVKHDKENQIFVAVIDGREAYLRYLLAGDNTADFIKTYVPYELRGKGIAGKVVEAALIYARENKLKVIPSCSYVETFIERHTEYTDLVED
jgi:hypothetical protein